MTDVAQQQADAEQTKAAAPEAAAQEPTEEADLDVADNKMQDNEPASKTLFVSNISWKVKRNDLKAPFSQYGTVTDCKIIMTRNKNQNRVKSKGYGFVTFETEEQAAAAKSNLQGKNLQDRDLVVKFSTSSGPKGKAPRKKPSEDEAEQKGEGPEEAGEGEKPSGGEGKPRGRRRRKKKDGDVAGTTEKDDAKQAEAGLPEGYRTLFLKTFPHKVQEEDVKAVFKDMDVPSQVAIVNRSRRGRVTALRAFAFVTFDTHEQAKKVYETCTQDGKALKLGEKELVVQVSRKQPGSTDDEPKGEGDESPDSSGAAKAMTKRGGRKRLYVSGLAEGTTEAQLNEKFSEFGAVTKCQVKTSKKPDNPVKFAYVNFQEASEAEAARKAMNEADFQESTLTVEYAQSRMRRSRRSSNAAGADGGDGAVPKADPAPAKEAPAAAPAEKAS